MTSDMWWQGPKPSVSSASFSEWVPVRPKPAPMTESVMMISSRREEHGWKAMGSARGQSRQLAAAEIGLGDDALELFGLGADAVEQGAVALIGEERQHLADAAGAREHVAARAEAQPLAG